MNENVADPQTIYTLLSKERETESTPEHVNGRVGRLADNVRNTYGQSIARHSDLYVIFIN